MSKPEKFEVGKKYRNTHGSVVYDCIYVTPGGAVMIGDNNNEYTEMAKNIRYYEEVKPVIRRYVNLFRDPYLGIDFGKVFKTREDALARGKSLASYIKTIEVTDEPE